MSRTKVVVVSGALAAAVVAGVALAATDLRLAAPAFATEAAGPGHGKAFGGKRLARLCSERRDERLDDMLSAVESFVDFTPDQVGAWNGLGDALRTSSATIGAACEDIAAGGPAETAPERLARLERMLEAGLTALQQVRPAFEDFYAVLEDDQKQAIDKLASHRRGHRRHH